MSPRLSIPAASLFTDDFKTDPYWWEASPRPRLPETPLPSRIDVLVVGSGYTGLNAALVTARAGRSTLVLEKGLVGEGCSTRNGGQISTSVKPSFADLSRRHGPETARAILMDGREALRWIGEFTESEGIDCGFAVRGRFHAAHSKKAFDALRRDAENRVPGLEVDMEIVPRREQHREIGTDAYHGGAILHRHAVLDPGRYHAGLLARAREAGAAIAEHCPAVAIERDGKDFVVATPRGRVVARSVVVATNGYTTAVTPWMRRRVIPIGSYIIATEPMPRETMSAAIPQNRIVSDTRKVVYYYRLSPDGTRMLFGGRVSHAETDPRISGPLLHAEMARLFPQLARTRISHSWMGFVAYTFDTLAHTGSHDGLHYAMGYCGSGVSMASYLGMRTGQRVLGLKEGRTGFDGTTFQTRPFYAGRPWFLAASVRYYRWRDAAG
jgi:glycine/D-amino acid oxidase-like deaminating enzyme